MQMRTKAVAFSGLIAALALSGLALSGVGCAGTREQRSTGAYLDDKGIDARVKTALFRDPDVSGFDVKVETFRGNVQLNGFVDTVEQKERAAQIVREVNGVRMVTNNLEVKPPGTAVGSSGPAVQTDRVTQPAPVRDSGRGSMTGPDQWRPAAPSGAGSSTYETPAGQFNNQGSTFNNPIDSNLQNTQPLNQNTGSQPQSGTGASTIEQPALDNTIPDDNTLAPESR